MQLVPQKFALSKHIEQALAELGVGVTATIETVRYDAGDGRVATVYGRAITPVGENIQLPEDRMILVPLWVNHNSSSAIDLETPMLNQEPPQVSLITVFHSRIISISSEWFFIDENEEAADAFDGS